MVRPPVNFFTSRLHTRTLHATLQLLGWLLLHPAAWRACSEQVASHLPSDFALGRLRLRELRSTELRRLLQIVYGFYPLLTLLITLALLLLLRQPMVAVAFGTLLGTVAGWVTGVLLGAAVSVPAGLVGVVAGVVAGVGAGTGGLFVLEEGGAVTGLMAERDGLFYGVSLAEMAGWIALGMIGSVAAITAPRAAGRVLPAPGHVSVWQQIVHTILGRNRVGIRLWRRIGALAAGAAVAAVVVALLALVEQNGAALVWLLNGSGAWRGLIVAGLLGIFFGLIVRTRGGSPISAALWAAGLAATLMLLTLLVERTTTVTLLSGLLDGRASGLNRDLLGGLNGVLLGLRLALLVGLSFAPLYLLGRWLGGKWSGGKWSGGEWSGAVAGALGSSGALALWVHGAFAPGSAIPAVVQFPGLSMTISSSFAWHSLIIALICAGIGVGYVLWLPLLLYPVELLWNAFLFQIDKRRSITSRPFLPAHSVFWDEHQWLPLPSLSRYLLLAVERNPWGGYQALDRTRESYQQRAVQVAQLALDVQWMLGSDSVEAILRASDGVKPAHLPRPVRPTVDRLQAVADGLAQALDEPGFYARQEQLQALEEALDDLLRDLAPQGNRHIVQLRPVATRWRQLIWHYAEAQAASIEVRKALDSPYIVGMPLTLKHDLFVGRTALAAQLTAAVRESQTPLFLHGARLSGKTSLLNNLGPLLPREIVPLVVDVQALVTEGDSVESFLYLLARAMINAARRQRSRSLPPLPRDALRNSPLVVFDEWLDDVEVELENSIALLALDAYEVLDDTVAMTRFDADATMGTICRAVAERPGFRLLVSGGRPPAQLEYWPRYLTHVQTETLGRLTERESRKLIQDPTPKFALRYEPGAVERILALSGGHPALTQLLCHVVVALKNEGLPGVRGLATVQDVNHAVPVALRMGDFFFGELTRTLGSRSVDMARMLALRGTGAHLTHGELARHFPFYLDETLQHLQDSGIIEPLSDTDSTESELAWRFQVELMRIWFVEFHPRGDEVEQAEN